jgi:hypothetical protein
MAFLPRPVNQRSAQPLHDDSRQDGRAIDRGVPDRQIGLRQDFGSGALSPRRAAGGAKADEINSKRRRTMFRLIVIATATAGLLASTVSIASAQGRHHSRFYAPTYGYCSGERGNATNTNGF